MSNSDQPFNDLEKLLQTTPEPAKDAREKARRLAMQAFAESHAEAGESALAGNNKPTQTSAEAESVEIKDRQGFWPRLRQTLTQQLTEVFDMKKQWLVSGAFASVSLIAVTFVLVRVTQPELITTAPGVERERVLEEVVVAAEPAPGREAPEMAEAMADVSAGPSEADLAARASVERQRQAEIVMAQRKQAEERKMVMAAPSQSPLVTSMPAPMLMEDNAIVPPASGLAGDDEFNELDSNPVQRVAESPVSTFSVDVDTASYSFVRRMLNNGVLPQKDAVRLEEMVNYFDYQYPLPESKKVPFSTSVVVQDSPWRAGNKLIQIGIKGYELPREQLPKSNLVFLLDVSGSMSQPDKLPLVKQSMELLLSQLNQDDSVAIVVYAGAAGTVLEPTAVREREKIVQALNQLTAGGSTAGGEGIQLAYQLAESQYDDKAVNRVILATDGDFNVGITDHSALTDFIERKRDKGIYLSVLGFGQGNYHDNLMQNLAQNGNGVAAYIDTLSEAQKVLVHQATSTLFTIAKDVKIQVEFNPVTVAEYRLLGFESRLLKQEDFNNDKVDAGDIGAGHTVTAIYEITPVGSDSSLIDDSRYQPGEQPVADKGDEYGFLKLRYKLPGDDNSQLIQQPILIKGGNTSELLRREANFATAVAGFAQLLRGGQYTGNWSYDDALGLAQANKGDDAYGYRTEFVQLVRKAKLAKGM
ncbi:VWA domain-containing protein [Halioxenophilus sp. WMMB6]|uniref:vWA domain-containing protein n=1 Tax=Halioxenophilus sp. WMMB6 TaxID=3073815 RepID=UPI00295EA206|nr:VWA domain-containing protein [Halioxenophilus sp. WMMB6]